MAKMLISGSHDVTVWWRESGGERAKIASCAPSDLVSKKNTTSAVWQGWAFQAKIIFKDCLVLFDYYLKIVPHHHMYAHMHVVYSGPDRVTLKYKLGLKKKKNVFLSYFFNNMMFFYVCW